MRDLLRRLGALGLAGALVFLLAACGGQKEGTPAPTGGGETLAPASETPAPEPTDAVPERPADPNVIVILAESFFDVTGLPRVEYEADPLAAFHRAQAEGVSGAFYTRSLSYGTCSVEMEVLTGINTCFFPEEEKLYQWEGERFDGFPALPALFRQAGYYTAFLHTFNDVVYNRTPVYEHLGFDDLYFSDGFAQVLPEAAQAENYWAYMFGRMAGGYYSDDLLADGLIGLYEREGGDAPVFLYGVTMENHQPFPGDKYDHYDFPFTADLDGEAEGTLNALTQGAADCSAALGKLMDYFSGCGEPTVIVFFGDHRPGLGLESGGSLYSALGMVPEDDKTWGLDEIGQLYATDYVIWANDARLLPAEPGTRGVDSSCNFLGVDVLNAAGLEPDGYWEQLAELKETYTAWTPKYFAAADGALYAAPEDCLDETELEKMDGMRQFLQESLFQAQ